MYVRGNPLKYIDPTGHCATTSSGGEDWSDSECWGAAHSILNMWDDTDYWSNRYTSKDVFRQIAARNDLDAAWMNQELDMFFQSDSGQQWSQQTWNNNRESRGDPILEAFDAYCSVRDCEALVLDGIGLVATASVAIACIPALAVCGPVYAIAGTAATIVGGIGVARTAVNVANGEATTTDLLVSTTTFAIGFGGVGPASEAFVRLGAASTQLYWDHVNPTRQVPLYE
jgi:hypothetical protein